MTSCSTSHLVFAGIIDTLLSKYIVIVQSGSRSFRFRFASHTNARSSVVQDGVGTGAIGVACSSGLFLVDVCFYSRLNASCGDWVTVCIAASDHAQFAATWPLATEVMTSVHPVYDMFYQLLIEHRV